MDDRKLIVSGENGTKFTIYVLDLLEKGEVKEYPDKEYIVYTFDEPKIGGPIKAYFSILKETETDFSLLGISDKNEFDIVQKYVINEETSEQ